MKKYMIFCLELMFVAIIPFVIWWGVTPTNVLNSTVLYGLLERIGIAGLILFYVAGIPVGIFGIMKSRKMEHLRTFTKVLAFINLCVGGIEVIISFIIICLVIFGRSSV